MTDQGFIGSFSTSAMLVSSAVAILVAVSAIVAFEGWPGPSADAPTETFLLTGSRASESVRLKHQLVLDPPPREPPSAEQSSGAGGAALAAPEAGEASSQAAALEPVPPPAGATAPTGALTPPPAIAPDGESPGPQGGGSDGSVGGTVDGAVGGTVDRATDAVNQVDGLGPVTDRVNGLVGGTESVTDAIGAP